MCTVKGHFVSYAGNNDGEEHTIFREERRFCNKHVRWHTTVHIQYVNLVFETCYFTAQVKKYVGFYKVASSDDYYTATSAVG